MEFSIVMILALLGVVGGRNIPLPKEDYLQVIEEDVTRPPAIVVKRSQLETTNGEQYLEVQANGIENAEDEILDLTLKDFDNQAATEELDTSITEDKEDASVVKVAEDVKINGKFELEDRKALDGHHCVNGTVQFGNNCVIPDENYD